MKEEESDSNPQPHDNCLPTQGEGSFDFDKLAMLEPHEVNIIYQMQSHIQNVVEGKTSLSHREVANDLYSDDGSDFTIMAGEDLASELWAAYDQLSKMRKGLPYTLTTKQKKYSEEFPETERIQSPRFQRRSGVPTSDRLHMVAQ